MNAALKEKWIAALRSGDYTQGEGVLRDLSDYCCMGVLCDVIDPEGWESDEDGAWYWGGHDELIGLDDLKDIGIPAWHQDELAAMNDAAWSDYQQKTLKLHDFATIADWIEKNIEVTP